MPAENERSATSSVVYLLFANKKDPGDMNGLIRDLLVMELNECRFVSKMELATKTQSDVKNEKEKKPIILHLALLLTEGIHYSHKQRFLGTK